MSDELEKKSTEGSLFSTRHTPDPTEECIVGVRPQGEGAVALSITEGEPAPFGHGTGSWAFLTVEEAQSVIDDLQDAVAVAEE
jgi:hypothetical protein